VASKPGGLNSRNDNDCEIRCAVKLLGDNLRSPTQFGSWWGRTTPWEKKRVNASHGTVAVQVQASGERHAEKTSGRSRLQQGLAATCKDPRSGALCAEETGRSLDCRMSPYERRRGSNVSRDGICHPGGGNASTRQRGSGHLAVLGRGQCRTLSRKMLYASHQDKPEGKPLSSGADACQRLNLNGAGKACGRKPRSEPDSGNPTVRDRREAPENVAHGGTVHPFRNRKGGSGNPPPTGARVWFLSRPGCGKAARPDLWRGLWATMIPTPTREKWSPIRRRSRRCT
jgi:hypothetical protein